MNTLFRLLTTAVLVPPVIWLLLHAGAWPLTFGVVTGFLVLWGGFEWSGFLGVRSRLARGFYVLFLLSVMLLSLRYVPATLAMFVGAGWWVMAGVLMACWPRFSRFWGKSPVIKAIMGILCLVPAWMAINFILFVNGSVTLLFLFALVWSADSGAWFFGKIWGRHRLSPAISPGKTLEGVLGGMMTALLVAGLAFWWSGTPRQVLPGAMLLSFVTVLFSVLGDLFESMLKREAGLKDSGRLLPGHGGLLDRIDGLLAASPVYVTGAMLLDHVLR